MSLGKKMLELIERECPTAFNDDPLAVSKAMCALADNLGGFLALVQRTRGHDTAMATLKIMLQRMAKFADGAQTDADGLVAQRQAGNDLRQ